MKLYNLSANDQFSFPGDKEVFTYTGRSNGMFAKCKDAEEKSVEIEMTMVVEKHEQN